MMNESQSKFLAKKLKNRVKIKDPNDTSLLTLRASTALATTLSRENVGGSRPDSWRSRTERAADWNTEVGRTSRRTVVRAKNQIQTQTPSGESRHGKRGTLRCCVGADASRKPSAGWENSARATKPNGNLQPPATEGRKRKSQWRSSCGRTLSGSVKSNGADRFGGARANCWLHQGSKKRNRNRRLGWAKISVEIWTRESSWPPNEKHGLYTAGGKNNEVLACERKEKTDCMFQPRTKQTLDHELRNQYEMTRRENSIKESTSHETKIGENRQHAWDARINFFHCNPNKDYIESTEVTILPR
jgi:hypothetical protein